MILNSLMKYCFRICFLAAVMILTLSVTECLAQTAEIKLIVTADHPDWTYKTGEKVVFSISVMKGNELLKGVKVDYLIGLERMKATLQGSLVTDDKAAQLKGGTLDQPGFLRCVATAEIEGKKYRGLATAGFDTDLIQPTTNMPKDFMAFWDKAKSDAAKIPMDAKMTLIRDKSTETVDVYEVNFQNYKLGSRIYGMLTIPKKQGKYPAVLRVPGAGVRRYSADIELSSKGVIVLQIGIHGIPLNMADSVYKKLADGELKGYPAFHSDDRDAYYFKRVFMGCIRANDFIFSLPQFDGKHLAVAGGSQGGALTIATSALDKRVKYMVAYFPGMCDHTGYLAGRTGGWPQLLKNANVTQNQIETSKYYDMVNFAGLLTIPGFYSWGFNDETCPPTSSYAAYNMIKAEKELLIIKEAGHEYKPVQRKKMNDWLLEKLLN
jgi:cephalosporin-C deacetylase